MITGAVAPRPLTATTTMSSSKGEGRREEALAKQREQMREEFQRQKKALVNETEKARPSVNRFVGQNDSVEETLKHNTVGLVHLEEFQQKRKELEEAKAREAAKSSELKYVFRLSLHFPPFPLFTYLQVKMAYRMWRICLEMTQRN